MPRRNDRAVKQRRHTLREARGIEEIVVPKPPMRPKVSVEDIVVPTGRCGPKRKLSYATRASADAALAQAKANKKPVRRVYACPFADHYHLTARETWEARPARVAS